MEPLPILTDKDIELYDSSSCIFYLKKPVEWEEGAYLIKSGDKILYPFVTWPAHLSSIPAYAFITTGMLYYPQSMLAINWHPAYESEVGDPRNSGRIVKILKNLGKLHSGIKCTIHNMNVQKNNVQFTYRMMNMDSDDLYILDPAKCGNEIFYHYNHAPGLISGQNYYWAEYLFDGNYPEYPDISWFHLLPPGQVMERTLNVEGYPSIPSGTYQLNWNFSNPGYAVTLNSGLSDGRIWAGTINVSCNQIIVP